jgi:transcriptional regulator
LRVIDDGAWLRGFVEKLTNRHEAGRRDPWQVTDAPSDFIEKQLGAIVGLEIPITRLIGKWKVSQNRPPPDRDGVVQGLAQEGRHSAAAMADLVRQSKSE